MSENCVFCKIVRGDIPSTKVYEDDLALAFRDITPAAPTHVLIVPKQHISSLAEISDANAEVYAGLLKIAAQVARDEGIAESGYRVVTNIGDEGGQSVHHLHFHLLGGRKMTWPPG
ncbi:MAG: histidine triad nucleotide-binding protein [Anaerolineae bacterium]|nr:histidine triad nucleotide-binding protein [Anaerolineae bacterium]